MQRLSLSGLARTAFALALLVACAAPRAQDGPPAQTGADEAAHLLEIRDGALWIDGQALPSSSIPEGLELDGLQMSVEYSGPVTPVVEVDGVPYVLQGDHLVRFSESDRAGSQVYFLGEATPTPESARAAEPSATLAGAPVVAPASRDEARLRRAGEAAYMEELSATDRELYEQIRREAELDAEAERLASEVRRTSDPAARAAGVERLRVVLAEAFDLKQSIREAEIERAEQQVDDVRRMHHARGSRRAMIVEHRLRELIGE